MSFPRTILIIALLIVTAVLILPVGAPAVAAPQMRYVDAAGGADAGDCSDPTNPCKTIGYALGKSFQSDDIKVARGTYNENLVITDNVNLYGGFDPANWNKEPAPYGSTIDGQKLGSVVRYEDGFAGILDGFKIINGKAENGGGVFSDMGSVVLQNLWISGNEAVDAGGGVYFNMGQPSIAGSKIENNKAGKSGGGIFISYAECELSDLTVKGNQAPEGGGISLFSTGLVNLTRGILNGNKGGTQSGAAHLQDSVLLINDSKFRDNTADSHGGAITTRGSQLEIANSLFYGNQTTKGPGAVLTMGTSETYIVNSTFSQNPAREHQAILVWSGFLHLHNSIMWQNGPNLSTDPPCPSCIKVTHSDVQGHVDNPLQDSNNIDADPLFLNPGAADFRLKNGSPCIDAGSDDGAYPVPPRDIAGNPRGEYPDMGAYEFVAPVSNYRVNLPMITGN